MKEYNIIAIGTDNKSLVRDSYVYNRIKKYSGLCDKYYNLVFTSNKDYTQIEDDNYYTIPVYGRNKLRQIIALFGVVKKIKTRNSVITPQDPFEIGLAAYVISKMFGMKLKVQMHTDISSKYFREESVRNKIQYYISLFVFRRADSIRVVSKRVKEFLINKLKINQSKIHIIPVYVDVQKFAAIAAKNVVKEIDCLILSRIERVKNIDLAIDAVYEINQQAVLPLGKVSEGRKGLTLEIVGSGTDKSRLQDKYKSDEYDFISWADQVINVEDEYARAKVFLISSKYEGYAVTAVEAVASGVPVVMTPVGCADDYIINGVNGEVSSGFTVTDYQDAIIKCLENIDNNAYDLSKVKSCVEAETLKLFEEFIK